MRATLAATLSAFLVALPASARVSPHVPGEWSPDGARLLVRSCSSTYCADVGVATRDGRFVALPPNATLEWSPDGRRAVLERGEAIYVASPNGTQRRRIATGFAASWAPDGRRIAYVDGSMLVVLAVDAGTARAYPYAPTCTSERCALQLLDAVWSPDGRRLAVEVTGPWNDIAQPPRNPPSDISILDVATGVWRVLESQTTCGASDASWSPDGLYIAWRSNDCEDTPPATVEIAAVEGSWFTSIRTARFGWAPRGHRLAYVTAPWVRTRPAGGNRPNGRWYGVDFAWSPDGKKLATVHRGAIWLGKKRIVVGTHPRWFPGGRWLAFARRTCGESAGIWVRDLRARRDVRLTRPC